MIFSILMLLFSCSKRTDDVNLVEEIKTLKDLEAQRLAFTELLSAKQKSEFWNIRIKKMIKENKFNVEQVKLLEELRAGLTSAVYSSKSERDIFVKSFMIDWQAKALQIIGFDILYRYLGQVNENNNYVSYNVDDIDGGSDCNCNKGSAFSCQGRTDDCKDVVPPCKTSSYGCGFALLYECNGRCTLY